MWCDCDPQTAAGDLDLPFAIDCSDERYGEKVYGLDRLCAVHRGGIER